MTKAPADSRDSFNRRHGHRWFRSLRARLMVSVNLVVALMVFGALFLDYRHQLDTELDAYQSALSDEARTLLYGVLELQHHGVDTVQRYIDAVCAAMQDDSSPGHYIVVDLGDATLQAQSHYQVSDADLARIKDAAITHSGQLRTGGVPLVVGDASMGGVHSYVSEESEPVIARIGDEAITRLVTLAGIGLIGALFVNFILMHMVTRPVSDLVRVVRRIGAGELGMRPERFTTEELDTLSVEIGRMSAELELRQRDRTAHLEKAQRLQGRLLPRFAPEDHVSVAAMYRPADVVAGDYYDVLKLPDDSTLVCVADVCGHGVPAAMGAAILKTLLLAACEDYTSLTDLIRSINERFYCVSLPEDFASMALIRVEPDSGMIEYVSAGHEPSYLLHHSGEIDQLGSTGMLLGVIDDAVWTSQRFSTVSTDRLILLTDGVTEAQSPSGLRLGRQAFTNILKELGAQPVDKIVQAITVALGQHCADAEVGDDQTLLVLNPRPRLAGAKKGSDE